MRFFSKCFFLLFFLSLSAYGTEGPFFWTLDKDGKRSYILGTIHQGIALEELQCSELISNRVKSADLVFTEVSPATMKRVAEEQEILFITELAEELTHSGRDFHNLSPSAQQFFRDKIDQGYNERWLYAPNFDWKELVEKFSYNGLVRMIRIFCIEEHGINSVPQSQESSFSLVGLDVQIQQLAQDTQRTQRYLDNDEIRLSIHKQRQEIFRPKADLETVEETIKNYDKNCSREKFERQEEFRLNFIKKMEEDYKVGKLTVMSLLDLNGAGREQMDFVNEVMLKSRNEIWLTKIIKAFENHNSIFIAAGLLHWLGEYNLLDMLKEEGFSINRIDADCRE